MNLLKFSTTLEISALTKKQFHLLVCIESASDSHNQTLADLSGISLSHTRSSITELRTLNLIKSRASRFEEEGFTIKRGRSKSRYSLTPQGEALLKTFRKSLKS